MLIESIQIRSVFGFSSGISVLVIFYLRTELEHYPALSHSWHHATSLAQMKRLRNQTNGFQSLFVEVPSFHGCAAPGGWTSWNKAVVLGKRLVGLRRLRFSLALPTSSAMSASPSNCRPVGSQNRHVFPIEICKGCYLSMAFLWGVVRQTCLSLESVGHSFKQ